MEGINRVYLFGNLGADPEFKVTQGGTGVLRLRLATAERFLDSKSNEWKERTEWHSVVVFGKRAEALNRMLAKGTQILVEGSIRTTSYEDRNGEKRYKTDIIASNVIIPRSGTRGASAQQDGFVKQSKAPARDEEFDDAYPVNDEDLPF